MVEVSEFPAVTEPLAGVAPSEKLPVTLRVNVVVSFKLPDVPATVTATEPMAAELLAVKVSVLLVIAGFGLNAAVTPVGNVDVTASVTSLSNPFAGFTVIVSVLLAPAATFTELADDDKEKLGGPVTVSVTVVVSVKPPPVPVTVMG